MFSAILGIILCLAITVLYVSSIYVWTFIDHSLGLLCRDEPKVIVLRSISVMVSTMFAIVMAYAYSGGQFNFPETSLREVSYTVFQTCVLMLGPFVHQLPINNKPVHVLAIVRNLVVAPVCEEIVFRFCFYTILKESGLSNIESGIIAPVIFAMAHAHHFFGRSASSIILSIAHTCMFGWIAFYLLLQRSLWDAIISHSICNLIGLPSDRSAIFRA